ncbi:MAG: serine/threonine-protein kinase [Sorangiineae bacterium]|nr:serine/threonine-protein kinase [Polyangiaceae bacterium]MEB2321345.1 serine/threonine-protein kinase [Sorangiineae bacterium]
MSDGQRYQVIERIAAGGMAEVYRGESAGIEGFRKKVAIKRVLPKLSANREFINMFLDEARLGAYLSHSRCVQVFDIGQGAGSHFIVMEYVDGADLKGVLEHLTAHGKQMRVEVALLISLGIAEGLAYAHQACDHQGRPLEIVHRDISPQNVLMTRYGEVKLVDFGLARASSHLTEEDEDMVKGKFGYLAPEVTLGLGADQRVDLFAAGILLWEMLAGRRLFLGENDLETFKLVRDAHIPDLRQFRPDVPEDVVRVLAKALARDRAHRYGTGDELARDLAIVLTRRPPVIYTDVAELVKAVADERALKRRARGPDASAMIGDLIIDALHDFSGVLAGDAEPVHSSALGTRGVSAGEGFEDPSAWGLDSVFEEAPKPPPPPVRRPPPKPAAEPAQRAEEIAAREVTAEEALAQPPPRERVAPPPEPKKHDPFWRRWFGS